MGAQEWSGIVITIVKEVGIPYSIIIALLYLMYKIGMPIVTSLAAITQLLNSVSEKLADILAQVSKGDKS